MDLTLLEISLDDAEITANAPFSGKSGRENDAGETDSVERDPSEDAEESGGSIAPLLGLVVLAAVVVLVAVVKRRLGGESEEIEAELEAEIEA